MRVVIRVKKHLSVLVNNKTEEASLRTQLLPGVISLFQHEGKWIPLAEFSRAGFYGPKENDSSLFTAQGAA